MRSIVSELTQSQLAQKYDINQGIVSICIRFYNVPCVGKIYQQGHSHPFKLYNEEKSIEAFKQYFRKKAEDERIKARGFDDLAESFRAKYEYEILFSNEEKKSLPKRVK